MSTSRTSKVFALSLGQALTTVVSLVSGMVLSRVLSMGDLATYRQTLLAYDVLLPLLSLGVASGLYYFLPTETTRVRGVVMDGLLLMVGMGLLYGIFIACGGNHLLAKRFSNPAIVPTLAYLVPLPVVMLPAGLLASVMVTRNRVRQLTAYNVLSSLLLTSAIIVACLVWRTPESMVLVRVGASLVAGLAAIVLIFQALPRDDWRPRWSNMKRMVGYSIPLVGASALGAISVQLDKLIVSSMCSPEQFAVYSNGAIQIPLVGIVTGSIAAVIQPDLRRLVAANDAPAALSLFRQAAIKSAVILIPTMVFLLVSAKPFILTLFSRKYAGSVLPFQLYLLILPVRIVHWGSFLMALGKTKVILSRTLVGLGANLVLSIVLVRWMGYMGAIVSTIICLYSINCALNLTVISRAVGCSWRDVVPFAGIARLLVAALVAGLPVWLMGRLAMEWPHGWILAANAAIFTVALAGAAWLFDVAPLKVEARRAWNRAEAMFR